MSIANELVVDENQTRQNVAVRFDNFLLNSGKAELTGSFESAYRHVNKQTDHSNIVWRIKSLSQRIEIVNKCYDRIKAVAYTQEVMFTSVALRLKDELDLDKTHKAIKSRFKRELPELGRWESLTFQEKVNIEAIVFDAMCAYEKREDELNMMLAELVHQVNSSHEMNRKVTFESALSYYVRKIKPNRSELWNNLTIEQKHADIAPVYEYLSVKCQDPDLSRSNMLNDIKNVLESEGTHVKIKGLLSQLSNYPSLYRDNIKQNFRNMSFDDKIILRENLLKHNRNGVLAGQDKTFRAVKSWIVGNICYSTTDLYALIVKTEPQHVTRTAFANRLKRFAERESETINFTMPFKLSDEQARDLIRKQCTVLPGLIYKITLLNGEFKDHVYIGQTQTYLDSRVEKHIADALKPKNKDSNRLMYRAIRSLNSLSGGMRDHIQIMILEDEIRYSNLCARETYYIEQYWGDKCLNTHPNGNSTSGSAPTVFVTVSTGERMGVSEAIRYEKKLLGIDDRGFDARVTAFRARYINDLGYESNRAFSAAIRAASQGVLKRKSRVGGTKFKCGNEFLTSKQISLELNLKIGPNSAESKLSRLGYYQKSNFKMVNFYKVYQLDVKPYFDGTLKAPTTPPAKKLVPTLSDAFLTRWNINIPNNCAYSSLAKLLTASMGVQIHKGSVMNQAKKSSNGDDTFEEYLNAFLLSKTSQ
ncbi:hypothetical protein [Shewanella algicola]|uniref:hypothetical protein n=1 Tax=Shewanella algicola TaxID=640633 RepID=UPI002493FF53|nr:hypothetical protein [Shewanella algicola]